MALKKKMNPYLLDIISVVTKLCFLANEKSNLVIL